MMNTVINHLSSGKSKEQQQDVLFHSLPKNVILRPGRPADVKEIVRVLVDAFPHFFLTNLGLPFLRAYYSLVINYNDHMVFVAEENGKAIGFVAGFVDPANFYKTMILKAYNFVFPLIFALIKHPILLPRLWKNIYKVLLIKQHTEYNSTLACELASLAVAPPQMNKGLGKALVQEFITVAAIKNIGQVRLTTDAQDNDAINNFYQKIGFKLFRTYLAFDTRPMNEYVLDFINKKS
jgi:ribosomal protein S18 acetylase RimI-like enzyme